jgi:transcriptional regulator with XRE-family HTH domain
VNAAKSFSDSFLARRSWRRASQGEVLTYYNESPTLETMNAIRDARLRRGISQRKLAERSGLSFRGVQLLESVGHDSRLSSLTKVLSALDLPPQGVEFLLEEFIQLHPDSFRAASMRMHNGEFDSWPGPLFDAIDSFRSSLSGELIQAPPIEGLDPRLEALIASTVESLCAELSTEPPMWCRGVAALSQPWFVAGIENLKASALVESSVHYRRRNVFVLGNFLERV